MSKGVASYRHAPTIALMQRACTYYTRTRSQALKCRVRQTNKTMAVKRNYKEVYELLENLVMVGGAKEVLNEIYNVMDKAELADVLEDVADDWDIEVNEDGTIEW